MKYFCEHIKAIRSLLMFTLGLAIFPQFLIAQMINEHNDLTYAKIGDLELGLDLYMPTNVDQPPLLVFVHGGAWQFGDKTSRVPLQYVENGFALASIDFRQSTQARFPAQIHDIKAAVRYLRALAGDYGYNANKIGILGDSSGGHLVALAGVTNGHEELEGNLGEYLSTSSDVHAIISYFGAHDFTTILDQSTPLGVNVRVPALELLLGALPEENPELAQLASPVFHVDADDPPLLLFHGDRDPRMPINQSHQIEGAYKELSLDVYFDVVHGAGHGGPEFYSPDRLETAIAFFRRTIDSE